MSIFDYARTVSSCDISRIRRLVGASPIGTSVKAKGIKLGNPRWQDSIEAAREARQANEAKQLKLVLPIIKGLQASGVSSLTGLAQALNERGIQTPQGRRWHPMTVKRIIEARA